MRLLHAVAVEVVMPASSGLDQAITLAERFVSLGLGGSAALEVASLPRGTTRRDGETAVRAMLAEFGIETPPPAMDAEARYGLLLWAFAFVDLPVERFEGPFYARIEDWDKQDDLERRLVLLLNEWDQCSSPADQQAVERRMRDSVRAVLGQ